jgi:hypothetical protein
LEPELTEAAERSDWKVRCATPPPEPLQGASIGCLSHTAQIQAILPHLQLIISENYPPAQDAINLFYTKRNAATVPQHRGNTPWNITSHVYEPELKRWLLPDLHGCGHQVVVGSVRLNQLDDEREEFVSLGSLRYHVPR